MEGTAKDYDDVKYGSKIFRSIFAIKLMNVSQCFTLLLPLLSQHNNINIDFSKIIKHIELFTFKYSAICKLPGNSVEKLYSKFSIDISNEIEENQKNEKNLSKNLQRLFSQLKSNLTDLSPEKDYFVDHFLRVRYKKSEAARKLLKYILEEFNNNLTTGETRIDFDEVNLEHILPQNPKQWGLNKKDIEEYVNSLGNLCLLHKGKNSGIGNKPMNSKIPVLLSSEIKATKILAESIQSNNLEWNESIINERANDLADLAFNKIWKY